MISESDVDDRKPAVISEEIIGTYVQNKKRSLKKKYIHNMKKRGENIASS